MVRAQVRVRWCSSNSVVHITITRWYQRRIYNFVDQCRCISVGVRIRSSRITIIGTTITATSTSRSTKKKKWWMEFVPLQNWTRSHLTVLDAWPLLAAWRTADAFPVECVSCSAHDPGFHTTYFMLGPHNSSHNMKNYGHRPAPKSPSLGSTRPTGRLEQKEL